MKPTRPDAGTNLSPHVHHPTSQLTSPGMGEAPFSLRLCRSGNMALLNPHPMRKQEKSRPRPPLIKFPIVLLSSPLDGGLISRAPKGDGGLNSRACLRILFNLLICPSNKSKNGRAPKGDGGLISRACLRILSMAALTVEHLKVMAALTVEPAYASSPLPYGRAP